MEGSTCQQPLSLPTQQSKEALTSASGQSQIQSSQKNTQKKNKGKEKISASNLPKKRKPNAGGPRKTSVVWDHFDQLPNCEVNEPTAQCKYCGRRYLSDSKTYGTSNLHNHLRGCTKYAAIFSQDSTQTVLNYQVKKDGDGVNMVGASQKFSIEECRKALAAFVIIDEQPFRIVEGQGFRQFCAKMQPQFILPSRFTVARGCYQLYLDEKLRLKAFLKSDCVRVALTTDCWTSIQNLGYLTITAHFIDEDWRLNKRILCFSLVPNHKGETIGKYIDECLKDWGIRAVFTITVDNASSNDVAISYLKKRLKGSDGLVLDGDFLHVRCCAHVLNLIVNDGLKEQHASIFSIRNAVKYVRSSPSRLAKFKECVEFVNLPSKGLVCLDVPTRWNSTYLMLETAMKFQAAFEKLELDDSSYVEQFGVRGPPSALDWQNVKAFLKFLKIFYDATNALSASLCITAHIAFHQLSLILCELNAWCDSDDSLLRIMAIEMKKKHDKYWGNLLSINPLLYLGVVFDPRYKLKFIEWSFEDMFKDDDMTAYDVISRVKNNLFKLYAWYLATYEQGKGAAQSSTSQGSQLNYKHGEKSGSLARPRAGAFRSHLREKDSIQQKNELEKYLAESCEEEEDDFDVLAWWKNNSARFPILSRVARDVLSTPVSTVASESAFSIGGRVLDSFRRSLSPNMVEALICAQNWMRSTMTDFKDHNLIEELENYEKIESDFGNARIGK